MQIIATFIVVVREIYTRKLAYSSKCWAVSSAIAESSRRISGHQEDKDTENGSLFLHAALLMRVHGRRAWHTLQTDVAGALSRCWISWSCSCSLPRNFRKNCRRSVLRRLVDPAFAFHGLAVSFDNFLWIYLICEDIFPFTICIFFLTKIKHL